MSYTTVGHCPICGAPMYCQSIWHGIYPPPNMYSCNCVPHNETVTTNTTSTGAAPSQFTLPKKEI